MAMDPRDDFDRDILDIIPERYDADADSRQARAGHRFRSYLTLGIAVVAVGAIVATGLHFLGGKPGVGTGVPVIKADERPLKIRPDDRGGMQVPNQDKLVYERMEQGEGDAKVERLLPPPETPQVPVRGETPAPAAATAATEVLRQTTPAAVPTPMAQPKPETPIPLQPAVQAPAPAAAGGYAPVQNRSQLPSPAPAPAAPAKVAAAPAPAPVPAAPAPAVAAAPKVPAGGDWLIQLGALRSAPDAEKEWARIQHANHDLLGALRSDVMRVELGEKGTFWRLRAGPLSEQAARQLCTDLKSRNQGCIIARK